MTALRPIVATALSRLTSAILGALIFLTPSSPAQSQGAACFSSSATFETRIEACTERLKDTSLQPGIRALVFFARASAFNELSETERALADLNSGLALSPGDTPALLARAHMKEVRGDISGAEADVTAALTVDAKLGEAYVQRAAIRFAQGKEDLAIADLGEARRLSPRDPGPYRVRGEYFLKQNKHTSFNNISRFSKDRRILFFFTKCWWRQ